MNAGMLRTSQAGLQASDITGENRPFAQVYSENLDSIGYFPNEQKHHCSIGTLRASKKQTNGNPKFPKPRRPNVPLQCDPPISDD